MITRYGMSERFGLMGLETIENQYLDGRSVLNCADATAAEVDKEVMKLLKECYERAKLLLSDNREVLDEIAQYLFEKETITGKEFMQIYRRIKGIEEPTETEKVENVPLTEETQSFITTDAVVTESEKQEM